ncbi:hypothetical protein OGAPHI_002370 [Ogataea philodendri]|uniref:Ubiquitin-protein ligase E3A N-terminal zinc-binding domain-containing protein n=1 Tax=Ogataea philodendri TaxID=1378263 RepID=A0A9P8T844_9ASCO|nr:uncharacterized protein OGAPHI_002370 [Ogataea philodendri]KAH3668616.1 hypothetical protein OGAPHI_002370 [Ogataea philodendri]
MFEFNRVQQSSAIPAYSDKIDLPESVLSELVSQRESLPHPMVFKIATASQICYAGVREFSAPEGTVLVSGSLFSTLQIDLSPTVQLELVELPKGTDLSIKPLKLYHEISDWKWFLEAKLTKYYCTLTRGQLLKLEDDFGSFELLVETLEPAQTVCIIDTDINLDVVPLNDAMAHQLAEKHEPDVLTMGNSVQIDGLLKIDPQSNESFVLEADTDFVVSNMANVSETNFIWHTLNGNNKLVIKNTYPYFDSPLYLLPFGSTLVTMSPLEAEQLKTPSSNVCSNCGAPVAAASKLMHENFCFRNNVKCPHGCGEVFLRKIPESHWHCCNAYGDDQSSFDRHRKYYHSPVTVNCTKCSYQVSEKLVDHCTHSATTCPYALHECKFCHLIVPRQEASTDALISGLSQHELECGSKTTQCPRCQRSVRLRDLESHMKLHELNRVSKPTPLICSNVNCIREPSTSSNSLNLCDFCFGPLYSNVNDPSGQKLRSRIERRYILQLNTGCGNTWCKNKECKSSGMAAFQNFVDILKHVKQQLMESSQYYFCVDLATVKKTMLVDMLADEHQYDRAWICKSVQATDNVQNARNWLADHAVKLDEA